MQCEGGSPHKYYSRKTLKTGDIIKKGQWVRLEAVFPPLSDDEVTFTCQYLSAFLCKPSTPPYTISAGTLHYTFSEEIHITYYYMDNTHLIIEYQNQVDTTYTEQSGVTCYLLQGFWETYKIPIIIAGAVGLAALIGYITLKKR